MPRNNKFSFTWATCYSCSSNLAWTKSFNKILIKGALSVKQFKCLAARKIKNLNYYENSKTLSDKSIVNLICCSKCIFPKYFEAFVVACDGGTSSGGGPGAQSGAWLRHREPAAEAGARAARIRQCVSALRGAAAPVAAQSAPLGHPRRRRPAAADAGQPRPQVRRHRLARSQSPQRAGRRKRRLQQAAAHETIHMTLTLSCILSYFAIKV